jgi:hypothetical protein
MTYAKALAASDLLPPAYRGKPANVLVALALGDALGLPPTAALYGINVIQGKPTLSAESMRAVVLAHGHRFDVAAFEPGIATVKCARRERPEDVSSFSFTLEDARQAGLVGGNYDKYPKAMLLARATSQACRAVFPDVLAGVSYTPDELDVPELVETGRPRVERLTLAEPVDDDWTTTVTAGDRAPLPTDPDPSRREVEEYRRELEAELVDAEVVDEELDGIVHASLDAGVGLVEPPLERKLTGPASRNRSHTLAGPATAAQLGKLRALMREQHVSEHQLATFAADRLGWQLSTFDELTRGQASQLIDAMTGGAA